MIQILPQAEMPKWLDEITADAIGNFHLESILQDSLYYPASGLNGTPVKFLAGNVYSFIYADYHINKEQFLADLNGSGPYCGFKGYLSILQRDIQISDIVPASWKPPLLPTDPLELEKLKQMEKYCQPFGHWSIWERSPENDEKIGPKRFSFLFFAGEMSAIYQGLYNRLEIAPKVIAIIQPGAIGGEWESVALDSSFFKKIVQLNPAGMPEYLLHGGYGYSYNSPCWREFEGKRLIELPERHAGLWKLNNSQDR